jgi:hypothetical protein
MNIKLHPTLDINWRGISMKSIELIILVLCFSLFACCENEPDPEPCPEPEFVELRDNFSEAEFENAIIGTWISVYEHPENANVIFMSIDCNKKTEITIRENNISEEFKGDLTIEYLRPTSPEMVTLAKLTINMKEDQIELSRVWFGLNNFISIPPEGELYLRNLGSPSATLQREVD